MALLVKGDLKMKKLSKNDRIKKSTVIKASELELRKYRILIEKIEEGARWGYARAFKHTDTPSEDEIVDSIVHHIEVCLEDVIDWEK